jgi:hypothetical protein
MSSVRVLLGFEPVDWLFLAAGLGLSAVFVVLFVF